MRTMVDMEIMYKRAREEGLADGRAEGLEEGRAEERKNTEAERQRADELAEKVALLEQQLAELRSK